MRTILASLLLAVVTVAAPALKADKSNCKCGECCACKDGRVDAACSCPKGECRCADVAAADPLEIEERYIEALCSMHSKAKPWRQVRALEVDAERRTGVPQAEWNARMAWVVTMHLNKRYGKDYAPADDATPSGVAYQAIATDGFKKWFPDFWTW